MASADLIITGANIFTVNDDVPWASAMAISGGKVIAIGTEDDVARYRNGATREQDLGGAFVTPGFVDAHNHHAIAGRAELYQLSFSLEANFAEVLAAVRDYAHGKGPEEWIVGSAWGSGLITELSGPAARAALDDAAGRRPVILTDDSHHNRFVNSRALELAGVTAETPDPEGGNIIRDEAGEPTGLLLETAGLLVEEAVRESHTLTREQHRNSSARAIEICHSYGITSFQDAAVSVEQLQALKELDDAGELHAWVVSSMTVNDQIFGYGVLGDELISRGEEFRSPHHRPDFIKIFLDGTPPGLSGAFLEPYLPNQYGHNHCGETTMAPDELLDWLRRTAERGISAKIHCTGDAAVRAVIEAVAQIRAEGHADILYQIAHGQFIHPDDVTKLAELNITIEFSPFLFFPGVIADALGTVRPAEEIQRIAPMRTLIDSGVLVAGGSDWPVSETPNAWEAVHGLVTRSDPYGGRPGQLAPEEAISVGEAIRAFTLNAARACGIGDVAGSLESGKSADFAVHSQNPFEVEPTKLVKTVVDQTWFAGVQVYAREQA